MNDVDRWIYLDGPEPASIRPLLDALRDLPPATPEDKERMARRFFERLDATLSRREEQPRAEEEPELPRASEGLPGTAPALEVASPPEQPPPRPNLDSTMQVPVMRSRLGAAAPTADDSLIKAVAPSPFAGNTVGAGLAPLPRLSCEQYASLRAELAVWSEGEREILLRYHVLNEEARRGLEEHWQTQLAADPEVRAAFERALAAYTAWLRRAPR